MDSKEQNQNRRTIKSFVKREGRLTDGQKRVLESSPYFISHDLINNQWDLDALFLRTNSKRTLEIGFGNGTSLVEMAKSNPDRDFLGVEVHRPGVGHLLLAVEREGLTNIRVIDYDVVHLMNHAFMEGAFDCVQIYFPDPWHKKRHHKRRLIQSEFVTLLAKFIAPNGILHCATDWKHYAQHILSVLNEHPLFKNRYNDFAPRPDFRPLTKFETRGHRLGHGVWDLIFEKI